MSTVVTVVLLDSVRFSLGDYKLPSDPKCECWVITTNFRVEDLKSGTHLTLRWKREPMRIKWIDGRQAANALNLNGWEIDLLIELYRPTKEVVIENATRQNEWFWRWFCIDYKILPNIEKTKKSTT